MRAIEPGMTAAIDVPTDTSHTASAVGNTGVEVVSTTALILFLEEAAHRAIKGCYEPGEASVGTHVDVRHVGACAAGSLVTASARVTAVEGRRIAFAVEAHAGDKLLMTGSHERLVVDLTRFLAKQGIG